MEKESFGELSYNFPKIGNKENSIYYKTFYSGIQNKKYQKTMEVKRPSIFINNPTERKRAVSSYSQLKNRNTDNISNKTRQRALTGIAKIKNSFSTAETDDTFFALSEIKHLDSKLSKRVNKGPIWKEKCRNIYDTYTSKNKKDIEELRVGIKKYGLGDEFDLKAEIDRKKYFPIEKIQVINEAKEIMYNIKKNMLNEKKAFETFYNKRRIDLHTFIRQNREICKKNYVINLLKNERNKVKTKEIEIKKDLEDAQRIFLKDKEAFENFTQDKKKEFRDSDLHLDEAIRNNKLILEQFRKANSEVHGTEDEIEKNIKGIILYKTYADFIHKLLGKESIDIDVISIRNNLQNKDKDLGFIAKNVIKQFEFILNSNIPVQTEEINNPDLLTALFVSLEGTIIDQMSDRDDMMKEKYKQKMELDAELLSLNQKLEEDERQLNIIYKELEMEKKGIKQGDYKSIIEDSTNLINNIYEELAHIPKNQKGIKRPSEFIIKNSFEILHKMEDNLNILLKEMENIQGDEKNPDETFIKIVEKVKIINKSKKHQEGRKALMKLQEEKTKKYLQRMIRYKPRGPIVYPPPSVLKRKKGNSHKKLKEILNFEEMLYYNQ